MAKQKKASTGNRPPKDDRMLPQDSADDLIDSAFPTDEALVSDIAYRRVFAVIPREAFSTSPEEFSSFLEGVFEAEEELESTLDSYLNPSEASRVGSLTRRVRALVPTEVLDSCDSAGFVDDIFNAFDEIEGVLSSLQAEVLNEVAPSAPSIAVVPEEVIADPQDLIRAIDRVTNEAEKLDLLFRQARHALKKLKAYRLTRRQPGQLLSEMRRANHIPTLQYVTDFLSAILHAAGSFEKLELPRPHIRDYLEYLYRMHDWESMGDLVQRLQAAVARYCEDEGQRLE